MSDSPPSPGPIPTPRADRSHGQGRKKKGARVGDKPSPVTSLVAERPTVMNLGPPLPAASNGLPGSRRPKPAGRGGPPHPPLFGLSPSGVCRAGRVTSPAGERLPHRFTLTASCETAVCFLRHFPYPRGRWALPTTLPCGARTFLERPKSRATVPPTLAVDILLRSSETFVTSRPAADLRGRGCASSDGKRPARCRSRCA